MKTIILTLIIYALTFGQEYIVLTEGQAELIKSRYGIYSELDPIALQGDEYILPLACLIDSDLTGVKEWLQKLPIRIVDSSELREEMLLPRVIEVNLGQSAEITANIPEGVDPQDLTFEWGRRTVKTWGWDYRYNSLGEATDSIYRPTEWNDWSVLPFDTQTITSPLVTNAFHYNKIAVRITHVPSSNVYTDKTIIKVIE